MWLCKKCHEEMKDSFDVCWNCGTSKDGVEDPDFQKTEEVQPAQSSPAFKCEEEIEPNPITCPRCNCELNYVGTKSFHEGTRWGVLGDLGELFVNKERFDVYCCSRCGRVEFFVDGIGEQFRPH
jgi:hypothetical protein